MGTKVITDNASEKLIITWDRVRFILIQKHKGSDKLPHIIILNPKEMLELIEFAGKLGEASES